MDLSEGGASFGVPLSNFVGWFAVGVTTVRVFQMWDGRQTRPESPPAGVRHLPYSRLLEPLVYFGILLFNVTLTFWIGESLLGLVGVMIFVPIAMLLLIHVGDGRRQATDQDLVPHARDYGRESAAGEPSALAAATRRSA